MICKDENISEGSTDGATNKYYWRLATAVSSDVVKRGNNVCHWVDLSATDCDTNSDVPEIGDTICHLGNRTDVDRQGAEVLSVVDANSPSFTIYAGINSYSLVNKEYIDMGVINGKAYCNIYGSTYIGDRERKTGYLRWNDNTKTFEIKGTIDISSPLSSGDTIGGAIDNAANAYKDDFSALTNNVDKVIGDFQKQLDGAIETWFYDKDAPGLTDEPAVNWKADDDDTEANKDKDKYKVHLGDLYYSGEGKAYRFQKNGDNYVWQIITDTDITKALEEAKKANDAANAAQGTADSKMKVFVVQPTNNDEYSIGDMWVNATYPADGSVYSNEILKCKEGKAAGEAFSISHWEKASKYTDDTAANKAQATANAAAAAAKNIDDAILAIDNNVDVALKDKIITKTEAAAITEALNSLSAIMADVTKTYEELVNNDVYKLIASDVRTSYKSAYDKLVATFNALSDYITNTLTKANPITAEILSTYNTHYTNFKTDYEAYVSKLNVVRNSMDALLNTRIGDIASMLGGLKATKDAMDETTQINGGLILSTLLALGYTDSGNNFNVMSGVSGLYESDTEKGGGIAFWAGGHRIDIKDCEKNKEGEYTLGGNVVNPADFLVRHDGTGYAAGGALWWEKNGKVHADPQSFLINEQYVGNVMQLFKFIYSGGTAFENIVHAIPQKPFESLSVGANGLTLYNGENTAKLYIKNGVLFIEGDLAVTGGITMYASDGVKSGMIDQVYAVLDQSLFSIKDGVITITGEIGGGTVKAVKIGSTQYDPNTNGIIALTLNWGDLTGVPTTFTPSAHTHTFASLTSKPTTISGYGITDAKIVNGVITLGTATITPLTAHQTVTLASGTNNGTLKLTVNGTATDNIAVKGLGSAAFTASSAYAAASHTHTIANVTGLQAALDGKSATGHTHSYAGSASAGGAAYSADKINSRGNLTAYTEGATTKGESGINLYTVYNNGYPVNFGNLIHINGSGAGQLLAEWTDSSTLGHLYYRSKRDSADNGWSAWGKVAYVTDNVASATKLTSSAGSSTTPVYFKDGKPVAVTLVDTANNLLNNLTTGTSNPTDADYYIAQYAGGGTTTTTYHRRPHSALYGYIKGKAEGTWAISVSGNAATATKLQTARTIWGQSFNGSANVSGAITGASDITMSGALKLNGITISKTSNGLLKIDGDLIVTGGITMYASDGVASGLMEQILVDGTTIKKKADGTLYADINAIGGGTVKGATVGGTAVTLGSDGILAFPAYPTLSSLGAAAASHTHTIANITNLQSTLDGKSATSHTHSVKINGSTKTIAATGGTAVDLGTYLTAHQSVTNKAATLAWGTSATIATIGSTNITLTMPANPNTDTKNTAGSTDTSSKIFLIGATSQAANPQTYSHDTAYVGTDGCLYSGGTKVLTSHQTIHGLTIQANGTSLGTYTPNSAAKTFNITYTNVGAAAASHTHTAVNGVTPEWSGSIAWDDTSWIAAWNSNGTKIKTLAKSSFAAAGHTHSYLPLSGGTMTGSIKFNSNSLPQKTLSYVCGIDAFADGGEMGWMQGSDFVGQYAPTKAGGGASGTWGISINGNAATATALTASAGSSTTPVYFSGGKPVACDSSLAVSINGNAATASKWATARTITLSGSVTGSVSIDGSGNVTLATTTNHTHSYLYTEQVGQEQNSDAYTWIRKYVMSRKRGHVYNTHSLEWQYLYGISTGGSYGNIIRSTYGNGVPAMQIMGLYGGNWTSWINVLTEKNYNSYAPTKTGGGASGTWAISISGNADTVDGYHASNGSNKPWGTIPVITTNGWMDVGKQFEFHFDNSTGSDYSTALVCTGNYSNIVNLPSKGGTIALTTDNVASASKWATARTITLTGSVTGSVSIDGSGNVTLTTTTNHTHSYLPLSGGTMTGTINANDNAQNTGIKFKSNNANLNALSNQHLILGTAIRFGAYNTWDWNAWAGLKYDHSAKTIYLGLADGTTFNANSAQSGGTIKCPGVEIMSVGQNAGVDKGFRVTGSNYTMDFMIGSGNVNRGIYDRTAGQWMLYFNDNSTQLPKGNVVVSHHLYLNAQTASSSVNGASQLIFANSGTQHVVISSNTGAIVINPNTSSSNGQLVLRVGASATSDFAGNIKAGGGITMYSDLRKKNVISDEVLSVKEIAAAPLFAHTYKSDENHYLHIGTSAQYWSGIHEDWFTRKDSEGYYQMELQNLGVAMGISLAREIVKYESKTDKKIRLMKKKINDLEARIKELEGSREERRTA